MRDTKVWISALILLILGLHAVPVLSYQGMRQTRWPFLTWAMYAKAYPPGPIQTMNRFLIGTTLRGQKEEVTPRLVGLTKPSFRNMYINPLYRGDSALAGELISRLNRGRDDPFVELRTIGTRYAIADTGVVTEQLPVFVYRAEPSAMR
ncbi:MAG TPA: hypothetical protein VH680_07575 [Gemmatimonadales bacterium]|jgi:hypothetical protein